MNRRKIMPPVTVMPEPNPPAAAGSPPPLNPTPAGIRQDRFTLNEGLAILQWPTSLSRESYEDFESWINLRLKIIKRSVWGETIK
jgi:hypothetical protein